MKRSYLQIHSSKFLFACVAFGLAFTGRIASAQQMLTLISPTVNDGGFESITGKTNFVVATSPTATIPYWGATLFNTAGAAVAAPSDSGAEQAGVSTGADNSATHSGGAGGFWQPGASSTAFNLVTTRPIVAGDVFTLTWYGRFTGAGGSQFATLFAQLASTVSGATYTYQPSGQPLATADGLANPSFALLNPFSLYTLTYTATAADAGKLIGLTYGNSGTAYIGADDFTLVVAPAAVPEPSTTGFFLSVGLSGVLFVRRCRRASV